jgi:hypothetical protein
MALAILKRRQRMKEVSRSRKFQNQKFTTEKTTMAIEKKSLISNMTATKKALIASNSPVSSGGETLKTVTSHKPIMSHKAAKKQVLSHKAAKKFTSRKSLKGAKFALRG